jgi:hypothetical protein
MPAIDLRALLGPAVTQVADLLFPDTVAIEAPVRVQDATGDPTDTWDTLDTSPALIESVTSRQASYFGNVPIQVDDVAITLPGDRDIRQEYRLRAEYVPPSDPDVRIGDRWDVVGVTRDPARVTTTVLGRRRQPGTPDEGS